MSEGLNIIHKSGKSNLILFIHGFLGSTDETWRNGNSFFPELLTKTQNPQITSNFDVGTFEYYTKLTSFEVILENIGNSIVSKVIGKQKTKKQNISIQELAGLLTTQLTTRYKHYENIIIIAHSMGGLIAKSYIIDEYKKLPKTRMFISLAVPHSGSDLANYGQLFSPNIQIKELSSLGGLLTKLTEEWILLGSWPLTKCLYGTSDTIVKKESACACVNPNGSTQENPLNKDHLSICKPKDQDDDTLWTIKTFIEEELTYLSCNDNVDVASYLFKDDVIYIGYLPDNSEEITTNFKDIDTEEVVNLFTHSSVDNSSLLKNVLNSLIEQKGKRDIFLVKGEPGVGKSIVAHALMHAIKSSNKWKGKILFVDLMNYEKMMTNGKSIDVCLSELKKSIIPILKQGKILLIVDGLDYLNAISNQFVRDIMEYLNKNVSVFFKRDYKGIASIKGDSQVDSLQPKAEYECALMSYNNITDYDQDTNKVLALIFNQELSVIKTSREIMRNWFFENRNNLRLLSLVFSDEYKPKNQDNPFSYLNGFFVSYINGYSLDANKLDIVKTEAVAMAYNILVNGESKLPKDNLHSLIKRISTQSFEMLGLLSAKFICHEILNLANSISSNREVNINKIDNIFPYLINKYAKEIINENKNSQMKYFKAIEVLYPYTTRRMQAFLSYLLGRFQSSEIKVLCKNFLLGEKRKIDVEENKLYSDLVDKEFLVLHRTIYISLIYLDPTVDKEYTYIKKILSNTKLDAINRGFHRQYYGDGDYINDRDMVSDDSDLGHFKNTFRQISDKITGKCKGTNGTLNLSVCTLLSLAMSRKQHGSLEQTVESKVIIELIEEAVEEGKIEKLVVEYFNTAKYYLQQKYPPITESLLMMYKLKHEKRSGWNYISKDGKYFRKVQHPESVSEHTDFTVRIAQVFLPESSQVELLVKEKVLPKEYNKYLKSRILTLLSVHDLGEYKYGDKIRMDSTGTDKNNEHYAIKMLSLITACHSSKLLADPYTSVYTPWKEYNKPDKITINHKIAKDIDNIECLMQLIIYNQSEYNELRDYKNFVDYLKNLIATEIGIEIIKEVINPLLSDAKG